MNLLMTWQFTAYLSQFIQNLLFVSNIFTVKHLHCARASVGPAGTGTAPVTTCEVADLRQK